MVRALWSAASGMIAQQTTVDTISNNIANVNTVGYKTEKTEFKSLLYQNIQAKTTTANGENKPISAQVGLGTRVASITSRFTQGNLLSSTAIRLLPLTDRVCLLFAARMELLITRETVTLHGQLRETAV